jgi:CobQ-like glutamine amidotransferase family enzyme
MKLKVLYLYPELLNLYGDRGNVETLFFRTSKRGIGFEVKETSIGNVLSKEDFEWANFIFMGGGSDLNQKFLYQDLLLNKKGFLSDYIEASKVGLFICGAYQLLGNYYETESGEKIQGLGIVNFYTKNEGSKNRSVGKIKTILNKDLKDTVFKTKLDRYLVGFENHGGQTYFNESLKPLGKVVTGFGNNKKDKSEGLIYKNSFGTYLHGPILPNNPAFCDFLIKKALDLKDLEPLNDTLILNARSKL